MFFFAFALVILSTKLGLFVSDVFVREPQNNSNNDAKVVPLFSLFLLARKSTICLLFRAKEKEKVVVAFVIKSERVGGLTKVFRGDQRLSTINYRDMIFAHKLMTVDRALMSRKMLMHNNLCTL